MGHTNDTNPSLPTALVITTSCSSQVGNGLSHTFPWPVQCVTMAVARDFEGCYHAAVWSACSNRLGHLISKSRVKRFSGLRTASPYMMPCTYAVPRNSKPWDQDHFLSMIGALQSARTTTRSPGKAFWGTRQTYPLSVDASFLWPTAVTKADLKCASARVSSFGPGDPRCRSSAMCSTVTPQTLKYLFCSYHCSYMFLVSVAGPELSGMRAIWR